MKLCTRCKTEKPLSHFYTCRQKGKLYIQWWCKDCFLESARIRYKKDPQKQLEIKRSWRKKNLHKIKASQAKSTWKIKMTVLNHYGGICKCCGENNPKFLSIDHINNDGSVQRRANKGKNGAGSGYYLIKKQGYPIDLQVLCYNCNMAKAFYKVCPHKEKND